MTIIELKQKIDELLTDGVPGDTPVRILLDDEYGDWLEVNGLSFEKDDNSVLLHHDG